MVGTISPSGPKLAGRHGLGMLSLAATDPTGIDRLPVHWEIMNEEADRNGHTMERRNWRLMGPMHLAETVSEAKVQTRYGAQMAVRLPRPHHPLGDRGARRRPRRARRRASTRPAAA